jgi:hypothetical protein
MEPTYLLAVVRIPLKMGLDGNFDTLTDHMTIDLEQLDELPESSNLYSAFRDTISQMLNSLEYGSENSSVSGDDEVDVGAADKPALATESEKRENIVILKSEIVGHPRGKNTSFKNRTKTNTRHTIKHVDDTTDAVLENEVVDKQV